MTLQSDWDPLTPESIQDPASDERRMRTSCPVAYTEEWGGFWAAFSFEDVTTIARDSETFCASERIIVPDPGRGPWLPLQSDPPAHKEYRDIIAPLFRASRLASFEPKLVEMTNRLIDEFIADGEVDIVSALARPLPALALALLLGLPEEDWQVLRRWSEIQVEAMRAGDFDAINEIQAETVTYFDQQLERRRAEPGDDVITAMLQADIDGRRLTIEELRGIFLLLIVAGHETTTNALSSILVHLSEHPEQRARLANEPDLMPKAIEELLRYIAPVRAGARTTTREVALGGRTIPKDAPVVMMFASGSRDAERFPNPDQCDFDRPGAAKHLAFGTGVHRCLGEHLARMELRVVLRELLRRIPDFEVKGTPARSMWPVQGFTSLELTF
jgi:cytochrome P450